MRITSRICALAPAIAAILCLFQPGVARAVCATSATVTATGLAFGAAINPFTLPLDTTATISIKYSNTGNACTETGVVTLSVGSGTGATAANRLMTSSGHTISYTVYQPPGPPTLTVWSNVTGYTAPGITVPKHGNVTQTITAYGRILSPQSSIFPGSYTDTLTITVTL